MHQKSRSKDIPSKTEGRFLGSIITKSLALKYWKMLILTTHKCLLSSSKCLTPAKTYDVGTRNQTTIDSRDVRTREHTFDYKIAT